MADATPRPHTPSLPAFKRWARDVQPAAKAVLMARVHADMERERVDAYITPIFASYGFTYGAMGHKCHLDGPIPNQGELYLCDDPRLPAYYEECDAAHRAHGFTGPHGHCPALVAGYLVLNTENALIDLAKPLFGIEPGSLYGENRAKYLELLIGACFVKDKGVSRG